MTAWLPAAAAGHGDVSLSTEPWVARSKSRETTYPSDITDVDLVAAQVSEMASALTSEVVADGRLVTHVAVKVRFKPFFTYLRSMKLRDGATADPSVVSAAALLVLDLFVLDRPVRLLGVRVDLLLPGVGDGEGAVGAAGGD
jgi:DNA polymerase IV